MPYGFNPFTGNLDYFKASGGNSNSGGNGLVATSLKTANYNAVAGELVITAHGTGSFTVTLPANPTSGDRIGIYLTDENVGMGYGVTIDRNGHNIDGAASNPVLYRQSTQRVLQFNGTEWRTVGAYGQVMLASNYNITASNSWENTGLVSIVPITGIYTFFYNVRCSIIISGSSLGFIATRLAISSVSAGGGGSERFITLADLILNNYQVQLQSGYTFNVALTAGDTVELQAFRNAFGGTPIWTASQITTDANGYTFIGYQLNP